MSNYKVILSGGGTGGHIYPAIAIANEIKSRFPNAEFLFVGAKDRMEMEKVPQAGYDIEGLWISGIQRKLTLKNLIFPFKVISSLWRARKIIKSFKPNIAIGTGGFASGPLLYVTALNKIPSVIQEQNSYPGITNKLLAKKAKKICVAYDGLERFFPEEKIIKTGNPVRRGLLEIDNKTVSLELIAYPNPTQNNLWLKFSEQFDENIRFVLTDNLGKLIVQEEISSNTTEIPMQELTAGTYHLMVLSNESTIKSFKILKTK